ncbi:hypothetical protein BOTNAR_0071g00250 [Botryotinia narcissicola]|uniref:Uncharacterized protein n=1 Tax=Botryotinia narcissicola TaxID=278944 RepID=A0A4Z1IWZ6_9HELO|nr:hypothetical protein BOTNAR_0071g00250 [Botryotinia narcissicola]
MQAISFFALNLPSAAECRFPFSEPALKVGVAISKRPGDAALAEKKIAMKNSVVKPGDRSARVRMTTNTEWTVSGSPSTLASLATRSSQAGQSVVG